MGKITEADYDMVIISEEMVQLCADYMVAEFGSECAENTFDDILKKGMLLKEAGRTPIYLCTTDMKMLYVTSEERINNKYH